MRKLSKRFFALVMALIMALSCTAVAFATEVEKPSDSVTAANVQPREFKEIVSGQTGGSQFGPNGTYTGGTGIASDSYFTIVVASRTSCTLRVWRGNDDTYYDEELTIPSTNGNSVTKSLSRSFQQKFPSGAYHYSVIFENPNASYYFQLTASDYYYDR